MKVAEHPNITFNYISAPPLNVRLALLEKDNTITFGPWKGEPPGQNRRYKGWALCPARDLALEKQMGYR